MSLNRINGFQLRGFLLLFVFCSAVFCARGADVLFDGLGKGHNFQQTSASTAVDDPAGAWEATAFVFLNPTGAVTAAYVGPVANPTQYAMSN